MVLRRWRTTGWPCFCAISTPVFGVAGISSGRPAHNDAWTLLAWSTRVMAVDSSV